MTVEQKAEEYLARTVCQGCRNICEGDCAYAKPVKAAFIDGYHECKKEHEWHDLRKDPNDYPTKEQLGESFIVAFAFNKNTQKYYSFDCAEYIEKRMFLTHTINGSNENNGYKVIAWKEIE